MKGSSKRWIPAGIPSNFLKPHHAMRFGRMARHVGEFHEAIRKARYTLDQIKLEKNGLGPEVWGWVRSEMDAVTKGLYANDPRGSNPDEQDGTLYDLDMFLVTLAFLMYNATSR